MQPQQTNEPTHAGLPLGLEPSPPPVRVPRRSLRAEARRRRIQANLIFIGSSAVVVAVVAVCYALLAQ
jgi:hypothetical protein